MVLRIAVTGSPGAGKSTLVRRVLEASGLRAGGMLAGEKRFKDRRIGFEILDIATGTLGTLADERGSGPKLGKYRVHADDLEKIGAKAIENALSCDLIVVDEVGPMELTSRRFAAAVDRAIASEKPVLVVLHEWSVHPLAKKIRASFRVITVTRENRDSLVQEIARELQKGSQSDKALT